MTTGKIDVIALLSGISAFVIFFDTRTMVKDSATSPDPSAQQKFDFFNKAELDCKIPTVR
ncbi:hypothetical protein [Citrobacter amalonaticus]|uniref:hypothetical protein n=1 Tax=Citrobacter amalonaticus TaxID=35703 RepID=UPI00300D4A5F